MMHIDQSAAPHI